MVTSQVLGEGNGTPLQYTCLENPMDGGAWWAAVHGVAKSRTWLSDFIFTFHFHALEKEMATHSSVLAWRIPGTGEPGGLPSTGSQRVRHDWSDLAAAVRYYTIFHNNPVSGIILSAQLHKALKLMSFLGHKQVTLAVQYCTFTTQLPFQRADITIWRSIQPFIQEIFIERLDYTRHCIFACMLSCIRLFAPPWIAACQAFLYLEFPRQEYWIGLPFPSPGYLPGPEIQLVSSVSPALAGKFFTTVPPGKLDTVFSLRIKR